MKLQDFLDNICLGELSNLYIGLEGQVELHPNNRAKLINYINQGLVALHSRFILLKRELVVRTREDTGLYLLDQKHSMSRGTDPVKYIDDTCGEPFCNDLIKVLSVHNEIGLEYMLNEKNNNDSLHTPSWNSLQIPHAVDNQGYFVIYQALSPKLKGDADGCEVLDLPPNLIEALSSFVAGKAYSHMNGTENKASGQEYMGIFDLRCIEAAQNDLTAESSTTDIDIATLRGFC